jgi:hypothetical protein
VLRKQPGDSEHEILSFIADYLDRLLEEIRKNSSMSDRIHHNPLGFLFITLTFISRRFYEYGDKSNQDGRGEIHR